ncbi:MAG: hypothetical protein M3459_10635, partial [Actinomycetota bacterium]|nr:hypothetical protein [Actinomycetota bacterium]
MRPLALPAERDWLGREPPERAPLERADVERDPPAREDAERDVEPPLDEDLRVVLLDVDDERLPCDEPLRFCWGMTVPPGGF